MTTDEFIGPPLEATEITVCNQPMTALVYGTLRGGRRIVIRDEAETIQFDSLDCVDIANAVYLAYKWMREAENLGPDRLLPF
jgi:hypothetical protein